MATYLGRLKAGALILIIFSAILLVALLYFTEPGGLHPSNPNPDFLYPRPVVELALSCGGGLTKVTGNSSLECPLRRDLDLIVKLSNNSSEPSEESDFAAGVLLVFDGGVVESYELDGFSGIIGADEEGKIIKPAGSTIIELFTEKLKPGESKEARVKLRVTSNASLKIAYRGWIIDEDDVVVNPVSKAEEHYIARYPPENTLTNPPDSRWAGENFLKYKTYEAVVTWIR